MRTRIKICGITRPADALTAARAGADAIGLVFDPSAGRYVTPAQAIEILAGLPPMLTTVGIFVDASFDEITKIFNQTRINAIQLNGNEPLELIAKLKPIPIIKAIRVDSHLKANLQKWKQAVADLNLTNLAGLVMETPNTQAPGGTGISNDWPALATHIAAGDFLGLPPLIAAGGLTPENVAEVIRQIHPWAVDVSSGVESARREKSPAKIQAFIRAVAQADSQH